MILLPMNIRCVLFVTGLFVLMNGGAAAQTDTIFLDRWHMYKQGIVGVYDLEGNFNPGRYTWSILTPSQSHVPGLAPYVDPNQIQPIPERPVRSRTKTLPNLIYQNCPDSDRCEFSSPQAGSPPADILMIRLAGIHAPHITATSCEQEPFLGEQAKNLLHNYLSSAVRIEVRDFTVFGKDFSGRVIADDQDLSELLVNQGLAVFSNENEKDWCS